MRWQRPLIRRFPLVAHPGLHVRVILWPTHDQMNAYSGKRVHGWHNDQRAFFSCGPYSEGPRTLERNRAGNIHLVRGDWDEEVVFHECLHVAFHLQRVAFGPLEVEAVPTPLEEPLCYSVASLASAVYKWLWEQEPNPKWVRKEGAER